MVLGLLVMLGLSSSAFAGIVTTGSVISVATPPADNANGTLTSASLIYVWYEGKTTTASAVTLERDGATGNFNGLGGPTSTLAAGSTVDSFLVHFDTPSGTTTLSNAAQQSITFNNEILGVILSTVQLGATDTTFGASGTTYTSPNGRGMESSDLFTISADRRTLTIRSLRVGAAFVDDLRVIVNPEPGTFALFGLGVLALGGLITRRRKRRPRA